LLHSMGLEAPQGSELCKELSLLGIKIEGECLTEAECVETLFKLLS